MDVERERRILEIAGRAAALEDDARRRLLADECAGDTLLREAVESILGWEGSDSATLPVAPPPGFAGGEAQTPDEVSAELLRRLEARRRALADVPRRYKPSEEVARGGQGAVLRAWDADLQRPLAMKVMHGRARGQDDADPSPEAAVTPRALGRFLDEARVTGQLDHPGIVAVHELGLDDEGRVFFTMKLVKGRSLAEIFERVHGDDERWTTTRALGVLLKVCEAMAYAHDKGVIHRDLKPANVMVGRFGEVYVMDWGLARILDKDDEDTWRADESHSALVTAELRGRHHDAGEDESGSGLITMDGDVIGTPAYMSPEQARGDLGSLGPPTDVYALGTLLYHLLSGRRPYAEPGEPENPYVVCQRVQEGPPEPIGELAPDAPSELLAICERAMARHAFDRYPDMLSLADDLRAFLEGRVVRAHRTGAVVEMRKWATRNRWLAASLVGVVLAALGGVLLLAWLERDGRLEAVARAERLSEAVTVLIVEEALAHATTRDELLRALDDDMRLDRDQRTRALRLARERWPADR